MLGLLLQAKEDQQGGGAVGPAINLPNDINNAPAARINYYKLFLEFMNYRHNNAHEHGACFLSKLFLLLLLVFLC